MKNKIFLTSRMRISAFSIPDKWRLPRKAKMEEISRRLHRIGVKALISKGRRDWEWDWKMAGYPVLISDQKTFQQWLDSHKDQVQFLL